MSDPTQLTSEEIKQYREQLKDSPQALEALDMIEECDGDLQDALMLIYMEETGTEPDKGLDLEQMAQKCCPVVCADLTGTILDIVNIIAGLFGAVGISVAVLLYILKKYGLENFCQQTD